MSTQTPTMTDQQVLDFYPTIADPVWRIIRCVVAHPRLFDACPGQNTLERAADMLEALASHDVGRSRDEAA